MPDDARPWIEAWHDALYGPDGFYRRDEGPAGHFATSAQGIPGVDEILAQTIAALAEQYEVDVIVDFACGRGELATSLLPFVGEGVEVVAVDVTDRPDDLDPRVTWITSPGADAVPPLDELDGRRVLVVAHEWLDVVPCIVAEADDDGVLREVLVTPDGDEHLGDALGDDAQRWADAHAPATPHTAATNRPIGEESTHLRRMTPAVRNRSSCEESSQRRPRERVEIGPTRDAAWAALCAEVRRTAASGSVVVGVDYAVTAETRSPLGTLTGFRDGSECPPVPDGSCDITAHVAVDSLDVDTTHTQREVMTDLFGTAALDPVSIDLATSDPAAYLQKLALRSAFTTAVHPDGLGAFVWFTREIG